MLTEHEIKHNVRIKIDTGFQDKVCAQQRYNALNICSTVFKDDQPKQHCEKYNVVYMVRAMLKVKNDLHPKTVDVLNIIHNQLCSEGY